MTLPALGLAGIDCEQAMDELQADVRCISVSTNQVSPERAAVTAASEGWDIRA